MSATNDSLPVLSFGSIPPIKDASMPPFGTTVEDVELDDFEVRPPVNMQHLAQTVIKAKRIAVVCGQLNAHPSHASIRSAAELIACYD